VGGISMNQIVALIVVFLLGLTMGILFILVLLAIGKLANEKEES
jgi:hypothetical protein